MFRNRSFVANLLVVLLILSALILPLSATAGSASRQSGAMFVPPHATRAYRLQVGQFGVTIPEGAMPRGGLVSLVAVTKPDGSFRVDFLPDQRFAKQVIMDFGPKTTQVYYHNGRDLEPQPTGDYDGDGDGGEVLSWHFSRYSGW